MKTELICVHPYKLYIRYAHIFEHIHPPKAEVTQKHANMFIVTYIKTWCHNYIKCEPVCVYVCVSECVSEYLADLIHIYELLIRYGVDVCICKPALLAGLLIRGNGKGKSVKATCYLIKKNLFFRF